MLREMLSLANISNEGMNIQPRILITDDNLDVCRIFERFFRKRDYNVYLAHDGVEALKMIKQVNPALIFLDIEMPEMSGIEVLREMKRLNIDIPVIIITGHSTMETAISAIRLGAYDYLAKPLDFEKVEFITERCIDEQNLTVMDSTETDIDQNRSRQYELVGSSPAMIKVYKKIGAMAATGNDSGVFILGESGTGKELVARQIHLWSQSKQSPFIAINMTVLPDLLAESELFGYEIGAFTGAVKRTAGKFEQAKNGTIFLDEIGSISQKLQQKLLRVLQEREFYRLGGHEVVKVKCRIITATNENIEHKIAEGEFREDLYYRLKVLSITLPPLRDRREDIPILTNHFLKKYSDKLNRRIPYIPDDTMNFIANCKWPGNVRELENSIASVMAVSHKGKMLLQDFSEVMSTAAVPQAPLVLQNLEQARQQSNELFEKNFIIQALRRAAGNVSSAAASSGISRQRFHQLMKKYGISASLYR